MEGGGEGRMAPHSCCSSSSTLLLLLRSSRKPPPSTSTSTSTPPRLSRLRPPSACSSTASSASYNGWADLAAAPESPFPLFPLLPLPTTTHLFLFPAAALALSLSLSLSRLPPLPLLAAVFTAGFAARHLLSSTPSPQSPARLPALLADLDAQARALRDQLLLSSGDHPGLLVQAVDRLRDAVAEAAAVASAQGGDNNHTVLREVADCLAAWARHAVRDLSLTSPKKKPVSSAANSSTSSPDVQASDEAPSPVDKANGRPLLGMLQFVDDDDDTGLKDAGRTATMGDARLERLVFKHRHVRDRLQNDGGGSTSTRFSTESMESSLLERTLEVRDSSYRFKIERRSCQVSQAQDTPDGRLVDNAASLDPACDETSDAADLDGQEFTQNVKEAAEILRKARESMADEETTDALLYKSARLLSTAVALRPASLVAVGHLGNTYLLHGELKLKISRELRTLLANSGAFLNGRDHVPRPRKFDRRILNRESISSTLVDVCEECESLLVEAGRSYRTALSIDPDDVKALYNWGLALIFRAQLLADIGPEAAVDADQVYLAAIDKFDAMLSRSNTYAPEALYRWGTALQQRSHLRPRKSREKIRLLEQAKSLFEDVLYVEADNKMVREALSSCISELNYHGRWL
ncbi:hypothetical protein U9M48_026073 [Paspalum notatum var. saurae]|uniref:Uncharacterized protein n=1 Tax=Paspalum notatum var. saurae TaxID=547442 RepID=A0AAQ3TQ58_PASNO